MNDDIPVRPDEELNPHAENELYQPVSGRLIAKT